LRRNEDERRSQFMVDQNEEREKGKINDGGNAWREAERRE
jgi:hypothetical protein